MLILVPLFIFTLGKILPEQPSSSLLRDSFWANKVANGKQYDIVVVGDSRIYRGVNPDIISERSGGSVFNFGFSSAGLDPILLGNAVKLLKPDGMKILLIGVTPASFTGESLKNEHYLSLRNIPEKDLWIQQNLYPYLTFFNAYSLADLKKISKGENYFQTFYPNGFVYSEKTPSDTFEAVKSYIKFLDKNQIDHQSKNIFLGLIKRLNAQGIKSYGFRVPVATPIRTIENSVFNFRLFRNEFTDAGGHWLSLPPYGFRSYDGSHLDGPSALKLSGIIGDSISRYR